MNHQSRPFAAPTFSVADQLIRLEDAVARRVEAEQTFAEQFGSGTDPEQETLERELRRVINDHEQRIEQWNEQFGQQRREVEAVCQSERNLVESEHNSTLARVRGEARQEIDRVNQQHADSSWVASSVLDETAEESPKRQFERIRSSLEKTGDQQRAECASLAAELREISDARGLCPEPLPPPATEANDLESFAAEFTAASEAAHAQLREYNRLRLPQLFSGSRTLWVFLGLATAMGIPTFLILPPTLLGATTARTDVAWVAATAVAALVASGLLLTVMYTIGSTQLSEGLARLHESVSAAQFFHERWSHLAEKEAQRREREYEQLQETRERQLQQQLDRYEAAHQQTLASIDERLRSESEKLVAAHAERIASLEADRADKLAAVDREAESALAEVNTSFEEERQRRQTDLDQYVAQREKLRDQVVEQMTTEWLSDVKAFDTFAADARQISSDRNRPWAEMAKSGWKPPQEIPEEIRIGEYHVDLAEIEGGIPSQERLAPSHTVFQIPAALPFPDSPSLLLETKGQDGRREAVQVMQSALLRLLTRVPAGKLRLTVIDPVGLGESFSGLMHLADYDELLITSRIWTEMNHIEARLAELTEHMENVLQKYLRNEFATIEQYNHFAGEVAEPYHVLVVADFPSKFSEQAARRLVSIANSGPRCGVYLLMSTDRTAQMPNAFDLAAIETTANTFTWRSGAYYPRTLSSLRTREGEAPAEPTASTMAESAAGASPSRKRRVPTSGLSRWPLQIDSPPSPEIFTQIVKNVGEASKDVRRVEVAFSRIAPSPDAVWTKDSRNGIDIPLGRAGATKLQHLKLGKGTSQHMLVAGKTGSGKSTFFHTLVTNVAMYYSPEEIELYLVDFKKGVEFKAYAPENADDDTTEPDRNDDSAPPSGLPHARVIAIESDREFGVSVLQRLDDVLNERGELFRRHNVQDIAGYRNALDERRKAVSGGGRAESREPRMETNGADTDLDPQPQTLNPQPSTIDQQPSTLNLQRSTLNAQRSTLNAQHSTLPRILLVIDEFQEFFVEDDRYSQQAALLLDRLVRQGRAFGVHVILGSQTLGGAYSLARSTLGQVAVRVALQCSEADAHLILSEENTAARLLTRPGEAIYNDANGMVEGNHPFQIAWLPDEERAGYLAVMNYFVQERGITVPPPVVFEGNVPSDPVRNSELMAIVTSENGSGEGGGDDESAASRPPVAPRIWLGESVEIGPPASVTFPPQAGRNLLLVGSDAGAATGILSTSLIALAAHARSITAGFGNEDVSPRFYVFDGNMAGSAESELWRRVADAVPFDVRLATPQTASDALQELTLERHRRDGNVGQPASPLFVFVAGVSKFRDLRRSEDDFSLSGFGSSSEESAPNLGRQFADLLSKGPELGIHSLLWADSSNNVDRWLGRQSMREFELRIAFPMNAGDSSNLIDSPAASKLGTHRALLYREETGTAAKFRPYGPPKKAWLDKVRAALHVERPLETATTLDDFRVT